SRFGETVGCELLAAGQQWPPMVAHPGLSPGSDHPCGHVVDGDEGGGGRIDRGHFLEYQRGIEARQAQAADRFGRIHGAESEFSRLGEGFAGEDVLLVPLRGVRGEFPLREFTGGLCKGLLLLGEAKIHGACLRILYGAVAACSWRRPTRSGPGKGRPMRRRLNVALRRPASVRPAHLSAAIAARLSRTRQSPPAHTERRHASPIRPADYWFRDTFA